MGAGKAMLYLRAYMKYDCFLVLLNLAKIWNRRCPEHLFCDSEFHEN
jgi:hypothetical protein